MFVSYAPYLLTMLNYCKACCILTYIIPYEIDDFTYMKLFLVAWILSSVSHPSDLDISVHNFERSMINDPGPCVLFATPGMISGGFSLEVFKHWAPSEKNLVTLPGYCVAGTIGHKLMSGKPTKIDLDQDTQIDVRCRVHQLAFSPHTDAKGIMDLMKFLSPKHVILVHGEKPKMASLKEKIHSELGIQCYDPANNETVCIPSCHYIKAEASDTFIQSCQNPNFKFQKCSSAGAPVPYAQSCQNPGSKPQKCSSVDTSDSCLTDRSLMPHLQVKDERVAEGILVLEKSKKAKAVHEDELLHKLGERKHDIRFAYCCPVRINDAIDILSKSDRGSCLQILHSKLNGELSGGNIQNFGENLQMDSFHISVCLKDCCPYRIQETPLAATEAVYFCCFWEAVDEKLAWRILSAMENLDLRET